MCPFCQHPHKLQSKAADKHKMEVSCTVVEPIQDWSCQCYFRYLDLRSQAASEGPIWHVHSSQNGQHETHHEPDMEDMEDMEDMTMIQVREICRKQKAS